MECVQQPVGETKLFKAANLLKCTGAAILSQHGAPAASKHVDGKTTFFVGARICIQDPNVPPKLRQSATITSWDELLHKWSIQWPDIDNTKTSYYSTEELNEFASLV